MLATLESDLENWVLEELQALGWHAVNGVQIAPGELAAERTDYRETLLLGRLRGALAKINPSQPAEILESAIKTVLAAESPVLESENWSAYQHLIAGVPVEYSEAGVTRTARVQLIDWEHPEANDLLAVNQFTVAGPKHERRPDIVAFVNGLPLALFELKRPGKEYASLKGAYNQTQTYRKQIPDIFKWNQITVISDGHSAKAGSFSAPEHHWAAWKTIDGVTRDPHNSEGHRIPAIEVLVRGMFRPDVFFDLCRRFVATFGEGTNTRKAIAKYHQYWAVNKAVDATVKAVATDGRIGVVWHTQGSGKSLEMAYYAGKVMTHPTMANPTIVILTDRNDLDNQLLDETFGPSKPGSPLPERPEQADSRDHLRTLIEGRESGGIIFTTIQKFGLSREDKEAGRSFPLLSDRRNIVVMVDEAHRSNYGLIDGFARNVRDGLPHAAFIGFTGTPIEEGDRSTEDVFGDLIDTYDMTQAQEDGVTVKVYYEPRLVKVGFDDETASLIDDEFDDATRGAEGELAEQMKSRWAKVEAIVGSPARIQQLAEDIVTHWDARRDALAGKAMIVTMSRRIAVDLHDAIVALRPDWASDDDATGKIKVVITGSASDPEGFQPHIRNKQGFMAMKKRACDPDDELELVIVRDMWLTGFDSPPMHTMYVDKPMRASGLMQAITRVNRTFKDKPSGLVVDYIGIAENLRDALKTYTKRDKENKAVGEDVRQSAIPELLAEHDVVSNLLSGVKWRELLAGGGSKAFVYATTAAADFLIEADVAHQAGGSEGPSLKARFQAHVGRLKRLFMLVATYPEATRIRDEVAFFDAVRAVLAGLAASDKQDRSDEKVETAVRQIISEHLSGGGVEDVFALAGLDRPDISVIDDDFKAKFATSDHKNLQLEAVRRIIANEVKIVERTNVAAGKKFSEMLAEAMHRYQNRTIDSAQVIAEMVELAKQMRAMRERGHDLGLTDAEVAFYDALADNESAKSVLEDATMIAIAQQLTQIVRNDAKTDWQLKETVRAKLRTRIKRLLLRYGYPPDQEASATELVLKQAEAMAEAA